MDKMFLIGDLNLSAFQFSPIINVGLNWKKMLERMKEPQPRSFMTLRISQH